MKAQVEHRPTVANTWWFPPVGGTGVGGGGGDKGKETSQRLNNKCVPLGGETVPTVWVHCQALNRITYMSVSQGSLKYLCSQSQGVIIDLAVLAAFSLSHNEAIWLINAR